MGQPRAYRLSRAVAGALLPVALPAFLALLAGCSAGANDAPIPTSTPTVTPTATPSPEPTPTLPPNGRRRWGYDPWVATGEDDPSIPVEPLPAGYRIEKVVTGLDRPTQLAVTPDGRILVAEQPGTVRVVQDGRLLDEPFFSVNAYLPEPTEDELIELGLTGIAVGPPFAQSGLDPSGANQYVYLYYTADQPRRTIIARVRDVGGRGADLEEIFFWHAAQQHDRDEAAERARAAT